MNSSTIPSTFVRDRVLLTWEEALWGVEHLLIDTSTVVDLATDRLLAGSDDPVEIELAALPKSEISEAGDLLRRLADTEPAHSATEIARKWLFLRMAWIYERRGDLQDPLGEAESAYADFGYPREVEGFMRYMPATWGYAPKTHTREENEARLYRLWQQYLAAAAREFGKDDGF
ncbi:MAG: DUF2247 family protein [Steroidobacteraceae bacterium]